MYWLVSLPWLDGSDERTWQLLQNKVGGLAGPLRPSEGSTASNSAANGRCTHRPTGAGHL